MSRYLNFILSGIIGAAVGVTYEGAKWYMNDFYPVQHLKPTPEAFHVDSVSFDIYAKLHRFRDKNEKAYCNALYKTDALFVLEQALRSGRAKPSIEDKVRARTLGEIVLKNAQKLLFAVQNRKNITKAEQDEEEEISKQFKRLEELIEVHVDNVAQMCKNCI